MHVGDLVRGEGELVQGHLGFLEVAQEAELTREEEHQTLADLACTRGTADSVDVVAGVIWGVVLDDPVYARDVEPTSGDVCA